MRLIVNGLELETKTYNNLKLYIDLCKIIHTSKKFEG